MRAKFHVEIRFKKIFIDINNIKMINIDSRITHVSGKQSRRLKSPVPGMRQHGYWARGQMGHRACWFGAVEPDRYMGGTSMLPSYTHSTCCPKSLRLLSLQTSHILSLLVSYRCRFSSSFCSSVRRSLWSAPHRHRAVSTPPIGERTANSGTPTVPSRIIRTSDITRVTTPSRTSSEPQASPSGLDASRLRERMT